MNTDNMRHLDQTPSTGGKNDTTINTETVSHTNLEIELENCHGINNLKYRFNFGKNNARSYCIYAPNGTMKTSFAKTLREYSLGEYDKICDIVYPTRYPCYDISINGSQAQPDQILVIGSYEDGYRSSVENMTSLIADNKLREQYDTAMNPVLKFHDALLKGLEDRIGIKGETLLDTLVKILGGGNNYIIPALCEAHSLLQDYEQEKLDSLAEIPYNKVFNEKVDIALKDADVQEALKEYIQHYNELLNNSSIFQAGFDNESITTIAKTATTNNFFKAGHRFVFSDGQEAANQEELAQITRTELEKILGDAELKRRFEKISNILHKNKDIRDFLDYITQHQEIIPRRVGAPGLMRKEVILGHLSQLREYYDPMVSSYDEAREVIADLKQQARGTITTWHRVVEQFNERFRPPFKIEVDNQSDIIFGVNNIPRLRFSFYDNNTQGVAEIGEEQLRKHVLSTGENHALYILNALFQIESRKQKADSFVLVLDDIADSFDYKNKYAILNYLQGLSSDSSIALILLTHNFDFLRSVWSRGIVKYKQCLLATREQDAIGLRKFEDFNNPFVRKFIQHIDKEEHFLTCIPFTRNLIEYTYKENDTQGLSDYDTLTSVLHIKKKTPSITVSDVAQIIKRVIAGLDMSQYERNSEPLIDMLKREANRITSQNHINYTLADKIVLSMAIRILAEEIMIDTIDDPEFTDNIKSRQFGTLLGRFKASTASDEDKELLERVSLTVSDNIHLNAFMYEPIIDVSGDEIRQLYLDILRRSQQLESNN